MTTVTYKGHVDRSGRQATYVDGVRFETGVPVEVEDDELVKELREGSERLSGHEFEVEGNAARKPPAKRRSRTR